MPELTRQSTAPPAPPPVPPSAPPIPPEREPGAPAIPPVIAAASWEDFPAWRETFLLFITDPAANETFRRLGVMLHDFVLEYVRFWPDNPEGLTRTELRAVVADLRHLEGFLGTVSTEAEGGGLSAHDAHLCHVAHRVAGQLSAIAAEVEQELGLWRGEA